MKRSRIASLATASLLALTVSVAYPAESDAAIQARLVGKWQEKRVVDCETNDNVILLRPDGTFEVKGKVSGCGRNFLLTWKGKWSVLKGRFNYTTTFSDPKDEYPAGESFSDAIVSVTASQWIMLEESTGNESVATRIR